MKATDVVGRLAHMMKKVAVMVAGALFAGVLSFVGAGGCEQTQNAFNWSDLCNR